MEILQVADTVAREKKIDKEEVLSAMELAIQKAGRSKYGHEYDIRATIIRTNGEVKLERFRHVVEAVENAATEISLEEAHSLNKALKLGDFYIEMLPPIEFGRVAAQTARQVIIQEVRKAERDRQFAEYKDKIGQVVNGIVKRVDYGNVLVDIGGTEALLGRDQLIPRENYKSGDRLRAIIKDVRQEVRGPQIFLSRTSPEFMVKLFSQEVPEIYDGIITIKAVARDPGSRAKISVVSRDSSIDPVGACVGHRGSRVQAVVAELQGEKVDIVPWSEDTATFVVRALAPAEVSKIVLNEETDKLEVIVPDDQLSLAIGRRGQNVRLASILTGWHIDIVTESDESEKRNEETKQKSSVFIEALDIDTVIAHLLISEGFNTVDEIVYVDENELAEIEGFDADVATELKNRALKFVEKRDNGFKETIQKNKVSQDLIDFEGLTLEMVAALSAQKILTLDDFADLSTDELIDIVGAKKLKRDTANDLIMKARSTWFSEEETQVEPSGTHDENAN